MTVAVVIVNWNGGELLTRCLESLKQQSRRPDHIIVVDNASSDDSLKQAGRLLRDVELTRLDSNAGFARANNIAAAAARDYDALALLNPDAVAELDWLAALLEAAERAPAVAAFASARSSHRRRNTSTAPAQSPPVRRANRREREGIDRSAVERQPAGAMGDAPRARSRCAVAVPWEYPWRSPSARRWRPARRRGPARHGAGSTARGSRRCSRPQRLVT